MRHDPTTYRGSECQPGDAPASPADALQRRQSGFAELNGVRLTLTIAAAHEAAGRPIQSQEAIEQAAGYASPGPLARSELAAFKARLHLISGDPDRALSEAEAAVKLVASLASASPNTKGFRAASTVPRATFAAVLVTRAEALLELRNPAPALEDAMCALSMADQRYAPHAHVAGILAVGACLVQPGMATPKRAAQVLHLCDEADNLFSRRRVRLKSPHRLQVRGLRALAYATLGSLERAEDLMLFAIEHLHKAGLQQDVNSLVRHLVWIIGNRAGKPGRAAFFAKRYGATVNLQSTSRVSSPSRRRDPNRSGPPKRRRGPNPSEDDDEPIGF